MPLAARPPVLEWMWLAELSPALAGEPPVAPEMSSDHQGQTPDPMPQPVDAGGLAEDDPRFDTHDKRTETNRIELIHALEVAFATRPGVHWRQVFMEKQMSADVIERFDYPASDPQARTNRYILELEHPSFGAVKSLGFPIFLSEGTARLDTLAPCIGQHSAQILRDLLGYSEDAVHACRRAGVVA